MIKNVCTTTYYCMFSVFLFLFLLSVSLIIILVLAVAIVGKSHHDGFTMSSKILYTLNCGCHQICLGVVSRRLFLSHLYPHEVRFASRLLLCHLVWTWFVEFHAISRNRSPCASQMTRGQVLLGRLLTSLEEASVKAGFAAYKYLCNETTRARATERE